MLTREEKEQLEEAKESLQALLEVVTKASELPVTSVSIDLSRLTPTGDLAKLVERVKANIPVDDETLAAVVTAAKKDIKTNSRFNGILQHITAGAKAVTETVLPLFL